VCVWERVYVCVWEHVWVCVRVCVYNWVLQRFQLLWACHVYLKIPQLQVLVLSRTSCFRSIPNVFYLKVSPLSTLTPVRCLSFGTVTYVTEQTHQILEMSFLWTKENEMSLLKHVCGGLFLGGAVLAYCCNPGRDCNIGQHTAFAIFALEIEDTRWIFDPLNQHSSKSFTEFFTSVCFRF
jgi:hypothetical protein